MTFSKYLREGAEEWFFTFIGIFYTDWATIIALIATALVFAGVIAGIFGLALLIGLLIDNFGLLNMIILFVVISIVSVLGFLYYLYRTEKKCEK